MRKARELSAACRPDWPVGHDIKRGEPCHHCGRQPPPGWGWRENYWGQIRCAWKFQDYCSNACRQAAYRERKRERKTRKRYGAEKRNEAMMHNAGLVTMAMMGFGEG